jgi:mannose-6-phosphate isomerase
MEYMILKMKNIIQDYAWGSKVYLQELTGNLSDGPLAELWMGVHPRGESLVETEEGTWVPLSGLIKENPDATIGSALNSQFGNLPFLFKLLAAGEPLSIQAHPSKAQAEEGFRKEEESGVPIDAFDRNYKDDNHKPEIICALTPYWAMKGFRSPDEIRGNFLPWLPEKAASLLFPVSRKDEKEDLRAFFRALMSLEGELKEEVLKKALAWCGQEESDACRWVLKMNEKYPGDIGILSPLYLHTFCLQPGEALYLPAGELHAYLQGFGVELMANSDNVLRGGLTPKHMDVPELMKTLTFQCDPPDVLTPRVLPDGSAIYDTNSKEFQLITIDLKKDVSAIHLEAGYPAAVFVVTEGAVAVKEGGNSLVLKAGESCFLSRDRKGRNLSSLAGSAKGFIARAVPE